MQKVSCIVCSYNEAERIEHLLSAVIGHPELLEVIVVNDGSTDDTLERLRTHTGIRVISYPENKGKTYAMSLGIEAAQGDIILFLDADLAGLTRGDVSALLEPVKTGRADASISLRRNSLLVYRMIGLDFVSGERVLSKETLAPLVPRMKRLPRWGAEVYINQILIRNKTRLAVVFWPQVYNIRKYDKVGFIRGIKAELFMTWDAFHVLPLPETLMQNVSLLRQKVRPVR